MSVTLCLHRPAAQRNVEYRVESTILARLHYVGVGGCHILYSHREGTVTMCENYSAAARRQCLCFLLAVCIAAIILLGLFSFSTQAAAVEDVNLSIDGEIVTSEVPPRITDDRILVPVRFVSENLGWTVDWLQETRQVLIVRPSDGFSVILTIDEQKALIDGEEHMMDVAPIINPEYDRAMVPIRFVAEALGSEVDWEHETRTALIASAESDRKEPEEEGGEEPEEEDDDDESRDPSTAAVIQGVSFADNDSCYGLHLEISGSYEYEVLREDDDRVTFLLRGVEFAEEVLRPYSFAEDKPVGRVQFRPSMNDDEHFVTVDLQEERAYAFAEQDDGLYMQFARVSSVEVTDSGEVRARTNIELIPRMFTLQDPSRVVIDFVGAAGSEHVRDASVDGDVLKGYRIGRHHLDDGDSFDGLRLVLDLHEDLSPVLEQRKVSDGYITEISLERSSIAGHVIVVDPGHGGRDPGAISPSGVREKDVVLDISLKVASVLEGAGAEVIMTRTTDKTVDIYDRPAMANGRRAEVFISVHANADPNRRAEGTETYYHRSNNPASEMLARAIHSQMVGVLGRPDRGVRTADFAVLREAQMPAALLETLYLTSAEDERLLLDPQVQQRIAEAVLAGLEQFFAGY